MIGSLDSVPSREITILEARQGQKRQAPPPAALRTQPSLKGHPSDREFRIGNDPLTMILAKGHADRFAKLVRMVTYG
jgi:hypothetical protein